MVDVWQMDKASVLGDAIKYVKTLEEKLKALEERLPKKRMRSLSVKNMPPVPPSSSNSQGCSNLAPAVKQQLGEEVVDEDDGSQPEIEARKIDKNVLIRMHCEKRKSLLVKSLAELEKMKLVILNANILSFSATTVDLTCCAHVSSTSFWEWGIPPNSFTDTFWIGGLVIFFSPHVSGASLALRMTTASVMKCRFADDWWVWYQHRRDR